VVAGIEKRPQASGAGSLPLPWSHRARTVAAHLRPGQTRPRRVSRADGAEVTD
jgi:hypothetical protein